MFGEPHETYITSICLDLRKTTMAVVTASRCLSRSPTTGIRVVTSAVLHGYISQQIGRPFRSSATLGSVCFKPGRWLLEFPLRDKTLRTPLFNLGK
jgi:hypothetical protein